MRNEELPNAPRSSSFGNSALREKQFLLGRLFRDVNQRLNEGQDYIQTLDFLFESLNSVIPYDRISIALVEGAPPQVCGKWVKSKLLATHLAVGYCAALAGSSLQKILETGEPRIINDLVEYGRQNPDSKSTELAIQDGIRSSLTCPLRSNGKPIGIVFFSSSQPETYKNEHVHTYLEIADELSLIVEFGRMRSKFSNELLKAQNFGMILHDLKAPVGVIQGFLDLVRDMDWYQSLDSDAKNVFSIFQRNSDYMLDLLNELSELSQLNARPRDFDPRNVSLRTFIPELAMRGRELADKKEISFAITTDARLPEKVFLDRAKIKRIFDNLITNAVKFSSRGKRIDVVVSCENQRLVFAISDQGQGIPERELSGLFREFGKTSVLPTERETSTGLGLAIVKKIVEQHGGGVSVESTVGQGSTFTFWIPLREAV